MNTGDRIKQYRMAKGLTLKALGERIDMSMSFLSDIENGRSNPSLKRCREIAAGLHVPVSALVEEQPDAAQTYTLALTSVSAKELFALLSAFDNWSETDQQELLAYLKAKQLAKRKRK